MPQHRAKYAANPRLPRSPKSRPGQRQAPTWGGVEWGVTRAERWNASVGAKREFALHDSRDAPAQRIIAGRREMRAVRVHEPALAARLDEAMEIVDHHAKLRGLGGGRSIVELDAIGVPARSAHAPLGVFVR